jgi:hypothetical protein
MVFVAGQHADARVRAWWGLFSAARLSVNETDEIESRHISCRRAQRRLQCKIGCLGNTDRDIRSRRPMIVTGAQEARVRSAR